MFYQLARINGEWFIQSMDIDPLSSLMPYPSRRAAMTAMQQMREQSELLAQFQHFLGGEQSER